MSDMLNRPVVPIAGAETKRKSVTIYMHKGFDRSSLGAFYAEKVLKRTPTDGKFHLIAGMGSKNPLLSWPVYAKAVAK